MTDNNTANGHNALAHISALIATFVGGMAFLGPLLTWLLLKDQSPSVEKHAKEAMNFHFTMMLALFVLLLMIVPAFFLMNVIRVSDGSVTETIYENGEMVETIYEIDSDGERIETEFPIDHVGDSGTGIGFVGGVFMVGFMALVASAILIPILSFIMPIIKAIQAYNGGFSRYPLSIRFFNTSHL